MPILGGCLCFDLPTGSKFIGVVYLLTAILNTLALAFINLMLWAMGILPQIIKMLRESIEAIEKHQHSFGHSVHDDSSDYPDISSNSNGTDTEYVKAILQVLETSAFGVMLFFLVLLAFSFLSIISSSLLIHGIRKSRRGLLVPWIIQEILHILLAFTIIVFVFVLLGAQFYSWIGCFSILLMCFIQVFFIIVVISQYQALGLIRMHDEMCMK